jgi:ribonucleoside-diphosphate reductase beta chain
MVVEGMLAVTGQQVLLDFLDRHGILPGWREGLGHVARDEHRHVAYGTWLLCEKAVDPELRATIERELAQLLPLAADVLVPQGARPRHFRPLGWDGVSVNAYAFGALARRLRIVGVDVDVERLARAHAATP